MLTQAENVLRNVREDLRVPKTLPQSIAAGALVNSLFKKLVTNAEGTREAAFSKFLSVNEEVATTFSLSMDEEISSAILLARQWIATHWRRHVGPEYRPDPRKGGFGPGSSADVSSTNHFDKWRGRHGWSYSNSVAKKFFLLWEPSLYCSIGPPRARCGVYKKVDVVKITTVPKNDEIDRCICTEPSLNMFLQKAIEADLKGILGRIGIDLSSQQDIQRALARRGSEDGCFATIDLSSASDTVGLAFCEFLLPSDLLWWLKVARTPHAQVGDRVVKLNMISTMGNATTFPLETLIFCALVYGVYQVLGKEPRFRSIDRDGIRGPRNCGVFGDDIIVESDTVDLLYRVLAHAGFLVNPDKSFTSGPFRESCGGDYWLGHNVRPVQVTSLSTEQDVYSAYNRLSRWSVRHRLPLRKTLAYLYSLLVGPVLTVPLWESDDAGIQSPNVVGRYKAWVARDETAQRPNTDEWFTLQCILGGFISESSDKHFILAQRPRGVTSYKVVRRFSPNGHGSVSPIAIRIHGGDGLEAVHSKEWAAVHSGSYSL